MSAVPASRTWPAEGLARVPYWIYQDESIYHREQERIYRGESWNFLGLDVELPQKGDFKTTFAGEMPVVVTRDESGAIHCFENRCAHRGALLCLKDRGNVREIACVYHNWTYDLKGNLTAVAFRRGVAGQGGMPADAEPESQAPRKFRVEIFCGLMFATLSDGTPPIEQYIG
ncbi:MAG TPA: Rieske 2Fe-2S domain-containing protein, partial [Burkholderiales bacterium]